MDGGKEARDRRRRLARRAHRRQPARAPCFPQGAQGDQLVLHAGFGDHVRLPVAGGHRRVPGHVLRARHHARLRVDRHMTNEVFLGEFVRGMHKLGRDRDGDPDLPAHGAHVLLRRLQVPARAQLGHRRGPAGADAGDGVHRLPAAVRPALLLGHGRGREHQRHRPAGRPLTCPTSCAVGRSSAPPRCRASTPSTCCWSRG